MKNLTFVILASLLILTFASCSKKNNDVTPEPEKIIVEPDFKKEELDEKFGTDEVYIVKTYLESPDADKQELIGNVLCITTTHYQLSDSTWKTDDYSYKYKLILTGRMNNAEMDSTFHVLSNSTDITFDDAWKAFGFSSNSEDYFKPEDAIIVAFE